MWRVFFEDAMIITLAFDVYGTLIDTAGVTAALERYVGNEAPEFSRIWREKQLEYSFRRGLMQNYQTFAVCTKNALDYTCQFLDANISQIEREKLMAEYRILPAFPDVDEGLAKCKSAGFHMYAFSNGLAKDVAGLLEHASIDAYFEDVISVDEIRSFKPDPAVYHHFLKRSGSTGPSAWLISGNPFDVTGAISAGMRAAWIQRSAKAVFDPWDISPTITVNSLAGLGEAIIASVHNK
jgi:2-haloacid dehalogenase